MRRLILASASPRRRELLAQAGFTFDVRPAHVNEDARPGEDPIAYVVRLARDKAQAVFAPIPPSLSTATSSPSPKTLPMPLECYGCFPAARTP